MKLKDILEYLINMEIVSVTKSGFENLQLALQF